VTIGDVWFGGPGTHARFVITLPDAAGKVICVNITTIRDRPGEDRTCILDQSDHAVVDHPSLVFYEKSLIVAASRLEELARVG
jgi:hypothetical protein